MNFEIPVTLPSIQNILANDFIGAMYTVQEFYTCFLLIIQKDLIGDLQQWSDTRPTCYQQQSFALN